MPGRKRTWIVVADAGRARVFANDRAGTLREVDELENSALHSHGRDAGTDRPGRTINSVGAARHAEEPRVDLHRQEKVRFARDIGRRLAAGRREERFDDLILVAPPQLMGALRRTLDKATSARVTDEVPKDLVKLPLRKLTAQLRALLKPATAT